MSRPITACSVQLLVTLCLISCSSEKPRPEARTVPSRPSILLITLDTTRADSMGYESGGAQTPVLDALAARGACYHQVLTTAPMTLPAHASMLTGLYPSQHGIRENSRFLDDDTPLLAERLSDAGYATAAFVSGYPLKRRFGLARGFDVYDDAFGEGAERIAGATTQQALRYLASQGLEPVFIWVHYYDPHEPYAPPEPFRSRYPDSPYIGEVAYMDQEVGRLVETFEAGARGETRILIVGDHGEGLGDHGEALHGNLLYQGVMRVPMLALGAGISPSDVYTPVNVNRVFDTILAWAGLDSSFDLLNPTAEVVLGEALKPFLQYGWQPQIMAVHGTVKVIKSGDTEVFDLHTDPDESENLFGKVEIDNEIMAAIESYELLPDLTESSSQPSVDRETIEQLASLGYVSWEGRPGVRENAPNPRNMVHLFDDLDEASRLFVQEQYRASIVVFERVLDEDPENLMVTLRLAVSHSLTGNVNRAQLLFDRAEGIAPNSVDRRHFLAMHYFRHHRWDLATGLFEQVLEVMPRRLPAVEAMARIRESQGRLDEAIGFLERTIALKETPAREWGRLGELEMATGDTPAAINAFEQARMLQGDEFRHFLELGVCYLAARRFSEAAGALDMVSPDHPGYAMALFKRAQAAVLLGETDWQEKVRKAYTHASPSVRELIENEALFRGMTVR
jgi:tetratricopeptide (TPR) repeat protein